MYIWWGTPLISVSLFVDVNVYVVMLPVVLLVSWYVQTFPGVVDKLPEKDQYKTKQQNAFYVILRKGKNYV